MNEPLDRETTIRLRVLLMERELRQADVASALRLDAGQLSNILNGRMPPLQRFEGRFTEQFEAAANELRPAGQPDAASREPVGAL